MRCGALLRDPRPCCCGSRQKHANMSMAMITTGGQDPVFMAIVAGGEVPPRHDFGTNHEQAGSLREIMSTRTRARHVCATAKRSRMKSSHTVNRLATNSVDVQMTDANDLGPTPHLTISLVSMDIQSRGPTREIENCRLRSTERRAYEQPLIERPYNSARQT